MTPQASKLIVRPEAMRDIDNQSKYYRVKATAQLVQRWRQATTKAIRSLLTMPERGSLVDPDDHELAHVRRILIEGFPKHFIFYRSEPGSGTVIILRMLHGARDVLSLLKDDTED